MSLNSNPHYTFLPWARRGLSMQIAETELYAGGTSTANERAQIPANLKLTTNVGSPQNFGMNLQIIGPGDIIGISTDAVVKTEPQNWITNFEPHGFAFIDFYEEDFPWRYSPAVAGDSSTKLRPWLTLVVLKDDEFTRNTMLTGQPLNSFTLAHYPSNLRLPNHTETWAWAHVQVTNSLDPTHGGNLSTVVNNLENLINNSPDRAISRIICPRKLEENTAYTAFLIPTYETGRRAGLGLSTTGIPAQKAAWDSATPGNNPSLQADRPGEFPIYYEWYFRTGATGDFEYLVRQVIPRPLDMRVGRRPMDVQLPGYGLTYTAGDGTLGLEGALRTPGNPYQPYPDNTFRTQLYDLINLGEDMLSGFTVLGSIAGSAYADDPIVTPPLYGRWHALKRKVVVNSDWINELNLDPRHRVIAALGGEYVRKNQEWLMDEAWAQMGAVIEANKRANWGQLAVESQQALYKKNIESQPDEQRIAMTSRIHTKVKTGTVSVRQETLSSQLPDGAESSAFRKIRRPTGVLMKRVDPSRLSFNTTLTDMNAVSNPLTPDPDPVVPATARFSTPDLNLVIADTQTVSVTPSLVFNITSPNVMPTQVNNPEAIGFQAATGDYSQTFTAANWTPAAGPSPLSMGTVAGNAVDGMNPADTVATNYYSTTGLYNGPNYVPPSTPDKIVPAMAEPSFIMPMFSSVKELGLDFLIPNLNLIPQNTISLLEVNQKFVESFMVGANYEMGRELLWRDYPTDQRGTYFRHFWESIDKVNVNNLTEEQLEQSTRDIPDIDTWLSNSSLDSHNLRTTTQANSKLVLVIRGDLLKKFPNAVIYAVEADYQRDPNNNYAPYTNLHRVKKTWPVPAEERYPTFSAKIEPDITFLGFDLTQAQALGDAQYPRGWFFVLMERPGELRFGLDEQQAPNANPPQPANWENLDWNHVDRNTAGYIELAATTPVPVPTTDKDLPPNSGMPDIDWADDSAAMALVLFQKPVSVFIHASEMIPL